MKSSKIAEEPKSNIPYSRGNYSRTTNNSQMQNNNESKPNLPKQQKGEMLGSMFEGLGLNLASKLNQIYGPKYMNNPVDQAGQYSKFISCCGSISKVCCLPFAPCDCGPIRKINTGFIGLLMEFGRLKAKLPPGLHTINNCSQKLIIADIRVKVLDIPSQSLLTKDNVTVSIDGFITYKIVCPELAYFTVKNYLSLLGNLSMGIIKTVVVERTLTEVLTQRDEIQDFITEEIDQQTSPFGIKVISIEMQQVNLAPEMKRIMAQVAVSKIEAQAKVIDAKGNLDCAKCYRKSADLFKENPVSLKLQYLEILKQIASEQNKTYIIPEEMLKLIHK